MDVQLINLEGSNARLGKARAALDAAGIPFRRLPAFDGRKLRPNELPLYDAERASRDYGRKLTGGEVGCFLSHLEAARRFLATDQTYGLVLEDDLDVQPDAAQVLSSLVAALEAGAARKSWLVINLGAPALRLFTPLGAVDAGHHLMRAHYFPVTTTAILWNRAGAEAFLRDATVILEPVDHWLRAWSARTDGGLALNPPIFPAAGVESEIDAAAPRGKVGRSFHYFWSKQTRLQGNKLRAWRHRRSFAANLSGIQINR